MNTSTMEERWMTLPEVAEYLRVSKDLIYRLAQKSKIPASKVGNQWRFKKEKIDQWMEQKGAARGESSVRQVEAATNQEPRNADAS
jgi:excisionase family DNA binding protein